MTDTHAAVAGFVKDFSGAATPLSDDADIFDRLDGDDGFEIIERFATKFEIDITNYRWYFHYGEEAMLNKTLQHGFVRCRSYAAVEVVR